MQISHVINDVDADINFFQGLTKSRSRHVICFNNVRYIFLGIRDQNELVLIFDSLKMWWGSLVLPR